MSAIRSDCGAPDRSPGRLATFRGLLACHELRLRRASEQFALLAGETRLKILALLEHAGELCVCDLASVLGLTPAAVSQHLGRLRTGGLVMARRDGMTTYYRCAPSGARQWCVPSLGGSDGT